MIRRRDRARQVGDTGAARESGGGSVPVRPARPEMVAAAAWGSPGSSRSARAGRTAGAGSGVIPDRDAGSRSRRHRRGSGTRGAVVISLSPRTLRETVGVQRRNPLGIEISSATEPVGDRFGPGAGGVATADAVGAGAWIPSAMDSGPAPVGPIPVSTAGRDDRSSTTDHPPRSPGHHPPRGPTPVRQVPSRRAPAERRAAEQIPKPDAGVRTARGLRPAAKFTRRRTRPRPAGSPPPFSTHRLRSRPRRYGSNGRRPGSSSRPAPREAAARSAAAKGRGTRCATANDRPGNLGSGSADAAPGGGPGRNRPRRRRAGADPPPPGHRQRSRPGEVRPGAGETPLRPGDRPRHRPRRPARRQPVLRPRISAPSR